MTFGPIPAHDYPAIARAIAAERLAKPAPDLRGMALDARREAEAALRADPHIWAAIVEWADWFTASPRPTRRPGDTDVTVGGGMDEAAVLAGVTLRTAAAALRRWAADGQPGGEAEARAYKMLYLARRFARLVGNPCPMVDGRTGDVTTPETSPTGATAQSERKAA